MGCAGLAIFFSSLVTTDSFTRFYQPTHGNNLWFDSIRTCGKVLILLDLLRGFASGLRGGEPSPDGTGFLLTKIEGKGSPLALVVRSELALGVLVHDGENTGDVLAKHADASDTSILSIGFLLHNTKSAQFLLQRLKLIQKGTLAIGLDLRSKFVCSNFS